jgi:hypothetical protein
LTEKFLGKRATVDLCMYLKKSFVQSYIKRGFDYPDAFVTARRIKNEFSLAWHLAAKKEVGKAI